MTERDRNSARDSRGRRVPDRKDERDGVIGDESAIVVLNCCIVRRYRREYSTRTTRVRSLIWLALYLTRRRYKQANCIIQLNGRFPYKSVYPPRYTVSTKYPSISNAKAHVRIFRRIIFLRLVISRLHSDPGGGADTSVTEGAAVCDEDAAARKSRPGEYSERRSGEWSSRASGRTSGGASERPSERPSDRAGIVRSSDPANEQRSNLTLALELTWDAD